MPKYELGNAVNLLIIHTPILCHHEREGERRNSEIDILSPIRETVEVVHRRAQAGREIITLINCSGGLHRPYESLRPLANIEVRVKTASAKVRALKAGRALEPRRDGDWLAPRIPRLEIFETLVLE